MAHTLRRLVVPEEEDALPVDERVERAEQPRLEAFEQIGEGRLRQLLRLQHQRHAKRDLLRIQPLHPAHFLQLRPGRAVREHQPVHLPLHFTGHGQKRGRQRGESLKEVSALLHGRDGVLAQPSRCFEQAVDGKHQHRLPHVDELEARAHGERLHLRAAAHGGVSSARDVIEAPQHLRGRARRVECLLELFLLRARAEVQPHRLAVRRPHRGEVGLQRGVLQPLLVVPPQADRLAAAHIHHHVRLAAFGRRLPIHLCPMRHIRAIARRELPLPVGYLAFVLVRLYGPLPRHGACGERGSVQHEDRPVLEAVMHALGDHQLSNQ
mmetsp:Transcript_4010/g.9817  ORF Transcript_4010/g.9817 Transcript_4010/m.9817 type:complete len:323 (+) Transcript_4010:897-1865(+)